MKRVVITGGSNGIGLALAESFAATGSAVTSLDQAAPAKRIDGVTHLHCDVSSLDDVRMACARAGGAIDLLVLNAGVMRRGPVLDHPEDEFDLLFGVNAKGVWLTLKEAAPLLSPGGTVLLVSSYRAAQTVSDPGLYAASKAAGEHLARCAAEGMGFALKIARLGPVDTAMARHGLGGEALERKEKIMRSPAEIAGMLAELALGKRGSLSYDPATDAYS